VYILRCVKYLRWGVGRKTPLLITLLYSPLTTPSKKNIQRSISSPVDNDAYVENYKDVILRHAVSHNA